jgi:hypothetical protein
VSRHQSAEQNHNLLISNESFENVAKSKYFGTTVTNEICIHEEIKTRLNSGNAYYHAILNILSYPLKYRKTIILPVIMYGCETCSFTLTEEHRLRVFGNRVLRRKFGPRR